LRSERWRRDHEVVTDELDRHDDAAPPAGDACGLHDDVAALAGNVGGRQRQRAFVIDVTRAGADVTSVANDDVEQRHATDDDVDDVDLATSDRRRDAGGVTAHLTRCHGRHPAPDDTPACSHRVTLCSSPTHTLHTPPTTAIKINQFSRRFHCAENNEMFQVFITHDAEYQEQYERIHCTVNTAEITRFSTIRSVIAVDRLIITEP